MTRMFALSGPVSPVRRLTDEAHYLAACVQRGLIRPQPPVRLLRMGYGLLTHGSIAGLLSQVPRTRSPAPSVRR